MSVTFKPLKNQVHTLLIKPVTTREGMVSGVSVANLSRWHTSDACYVNQPELKGAGRCVCVCGGAVSVKQQLELWWKILRSVQGKFPVLMQETER